MEKISVCLRVRPLNQKELMENEQNAWDVFDKKIQLNKTCLKELMQQKKVLQNLSYEFNSCYGSETDNLFLFQTSVKSVVLQSLEGINGTIMMYGQTGAGKTFTMLGGKSEEMQTKCQQNIQNFIKESMNNNQFNDIGILVYSMMELFKQINKDDKRQFDLKCSYYEIYNENIYDLLKDEDELSNPLIFGTDYRKEFVIKNLKECSITSLDDVYKIIQVGEKNRHYAETILNHQSSRSHTVFKVLISTFTNENQDEDDECFTFSTEACINFIDLAGSEKISATPISEEIQKNSARKERNKESSSINKSLFFLTRVIALKTQKVPPQHIPYRNSTLTKLLKSSLTGNFKTLIILSINPGLGQYEQTNSTLRFGMSAKLVESKVEQNHVFDASNPSNQQKLNQLLQKIKIYEKQIADQQCQINELKLMQGAGDLFTPTDKSQSPLIELKQSVSQFSETDISQYEKVKDLSIQLQLEVEKNSILENNCSEMHQRLIKSNDQILQYFNQHKLLEDQLNSYRDQNKKLEKLTQQALSRLACYEGSPNFSKMSNEDMKNLESQLEQSLSQLQQEKGRRNSFQLNIFENHNLITQSSEPMRSDRSNNSNDLKKMEEGSQKQLKKSPKKESKPKLYQKQQSYFRQHPIKTESKSPIIKKQHSSFSRQQLSTKDYIQKIEIVTNKELSPKRTASYHEKQQVSPKKQGSNSKSSQPSPSKQDSFRLKDDQQQRQDIMTLADRLFSLSQKFERTDDKGGNNKYLSSMKKSEIIFETDSEVNPDSRSSVLQCQQQQQYYPQRSNRTNIK